MPPPPKLPPPPNPENLLGSKGVPLKGDPSAFHAFLSNSYCYSSSVLGSPCCFLFCSYMIFRKAAYVSSSNSSTFLLLSTYVASISTSPFIIVFHMFSRSFSKVKITLLLSSMVQVDSSAFMLSNSSPSISGVSTPFSFSTKWFELIFTWICLAVVWGGTFTCTVRSNTVCAHMYLSVTPPLYVLICSILLPSFGFFTWASNSSWEIVYCFGFGSGLESYFCSSECELTMLESSTSLFFSF